MLLNYGDVRKLSKLQWTMIELRSDKTVEITIRRSAMALPRLYGQNPAQLFIPVNTRALGVFELESGDYFFARCPTLRLTQKLLSVTGIAEVVGASITTKPQSYKIVVGIDDSFVWDLIQKTNEKARLQVQHIKVGSFVRLLDGLRRGLAGHVVGIDKNIAEVRVELRSKVVTIFTPLLNLGDMGDLAPERRVYFYSPAMDRVLDPLLLQRSPCDKTQEVGTEEDTDEDRQRPKYSRRNTVTYLVWKHVDKGCVNPHELMKHVVRALKNGEVRSPKNWHTVRCIMKAAIIKRLKRGDWHHVTKLNPEYKFTTKTLDALSPNLLPHHTPADQILKDGRTRRHKSTST